MRRILVAAAVVVLGSLVSVASPAQAASGPWSVASAGGWHTCAINSSKSLYCWGYNSSGQVGDGNAPTDQPSPTGIGASGVWAAVSAGRRHTCAITTGKSLYCWGYNEYAQIGDGNAPTNRLTPKRIGASGVWASVSAGAFHACAITTGQSLYCWGDNFNGQLGDGNAPTDQPTPKRIGSTGVWAGVSAGGTHTCAITTGKSLYCWGKNLDGQVGDGNAPTDRLTPKKIGASGVWARADAGDVHTCATTTGQSLYCWGDNAYGQIGDGASGTDRPTPKRIGASGVWARVQAGGANGWGHTCATTTGNSLYCWGNNDLGQVGDGTSGTNQLTPKKIGATGVWAGASTGGFHTCGISTGKALYCWGYNDLGQVGDGSVSLPRLTPKKIP